MKVEAADIVASAAALISVLTWYRSSAIEERIRRDDDARAEFDAVLLAPLSAKLDTLSRSQNEIYAACHSDESITSIQTAVRHINVSQHSNAYLALESFLSERQLAFCRTLNVRLSDYVDNALHHINEIDAAVSKDRIIDEGKRLRRIGDAFLRDARSATQQRRMQVRAERKTWRQWLMRR